MLRGMSPLKLCQPTEKIMAATMTANISIAVCTARYDDGSDWFAKGPANTAIIRTASDAITVDSTQKRLDNGRHSDERKAVGLGVGGIVSIDILLRFSYICSYMVTGACVSMARAMSDSGKLASTASALTASLGIP